jgi:hypothetical protein
MDGIELVIGYMAAWAWQKARRLAGRADAEVDQALDAGMDRLHELVSGKLAGDRALAQLETEAGSNLEVESVSPRTRERVRLALEAELDADPDFRARLAAALARLQEAESPSRVMAGDHGLAARGDVDIHAEGGAVASGVIHGTVNVGNPQTPGPRTG